MIILADYQKQSLAWLLTHSHTVLADEPGVGKTHPSIFAAKQFTGRKLVILPSYLSSNWASELEACDITDYVVLTGSVREKLELFKLDCTWTLVSYDLFSRAEWSKLISTRIYAVVIFDEAHRLRNFKSHRARAAFIIRPKARNIWMLTGTPTVANGGDIFPLLKLCDPKTYSSYWRFVDEHCRVTITPWAKVVGKPRDADAFNRMLQPYMMRRKLKDVLPNIPDSVEQVISVELDVKTRKAYELAKKEYLVANPDGRQTRIGAGGLLSTLRGLTGSDGVKVDTLADLLEDIPLDEQVVVYTWHRALCERAVQLLTDKHFSVRGFTGAIPVAERQETVWRFQRQEFRILIATLATVQEGINLQCARYVVFLEEDWTAASNEQAVARLRRRGQERTVLKYVILARKTVDEKVHKVQAGRAAATINTVFDELWSEDENT